VCEVEKKGKREERTSVTKRSGTKDLRPPTTAFKLESGKGRTHGEKGNKETSGDSYEQSKKAGVGKESRVISLPF